uniref:Restriction endonuclease n=1 Tax=Iridovirus LCIVAC01 TaxID=2506607 RepID=A0A481YS50_9VIRU|nr:MAG: restriction endonuclease [Iridovirus LCIVAC01]
MKYHKSFKSKVTFVEYHGCEMLSTINDYKNLNTKLKLRCKCNNIFEKSWNNLRSTPWCRDCSIKKRKQTCLEKYGYDYIGKVPEIKKKQIDTNLRKYGVKNPFQASEIKKKIKQTNLKKYGVENPLQSFEIKEKMKQTNLRKYGVENPFQSSEIKKKIKQTNLRKYGVENPSQNKKLKEKAKKSNIKTNLERRGVPSPLSDPKVWVKIRKAHKKKLGVDNPLKCKKIREKIEQTMLERYGARYSSQSPEIFSKILKKLYSSKQYQFPSGKSRIIQGYENKCLDILLTQGIKELDIITGIKNIPVIDYQDNKGKKRKYYPDIYISSKNLLIEVKSPYTYMKDQERNELKFRKASQNYRFQLWIFDRNSSVPYIFLYS